MHIKKGMNVKVISGNNKGQSGKILDVFPKKMKAIVEGINFRKRSVRPTQDNPSGGYVDREAPLHLSNLMVMHNDQATRIGYKKLENGKKCRKKLTLVDLCIVCKCGKSFCPKHRTPESHNCKISEIIAQKDKEVQLDKVLGGGNFKQIEVI